MVCSSDGRLCLRLVDEGRVKIWVVPENEVGFTCQVGELQAVGSGFNLQLTGDDEAWLSLHEVDDCVLYKGHTAKGERFAGKLDPRELRGMLERLIASAEK